MWLGIGEGTDPAVTEVNGGLNLHVLRLQREEVVVFMSTLFGWFWLILENLEVQVFETLATIHVHALVAKRIDKIIFDEALILLIFGQSLASC